jgi:predicted permease
MESLLQDLKYCVRMLQKSPGFTLIAVLTLALGIGANSAIFSMVYGLMYRPLPFSRPDRLMHLGIQWKNGYISDNLTAQLAIAAQNSHSFQSIAVRFPSTGCNLSGAGAPTFIPDAKVSADFFRTLGVSPILGRDLIAADAVQNSGAALLSYRIWQQRFAADPAVIGRQVSCNGKPLVIVGVLPSGFRFTGESDLWMADTLERYQNSSGMNFLAVARLQDDVTKESAEGELAGIFSSFRQEHSASFVAKARAYGVRNVQNWLASSLRTPLWLLFGAVTLVLIIACANLVGLMLARSISRGREIAIRRALGASRRQIVRLALSETLLLNMIAAVAGSLLAWWSMSYLKSIVPAKMGFFSIPHLELQSITMDLPVFGFTVSVAVVSALICGFALALGTSSQDLYSSLKQGDRSSGATSGQLRSRKVLLIAETALSVILLASAMLLVRSFLVLQAVDLGFNPQHLQVAELSMSSKKYAAPKAVWDFDRNVIETINKIPGVRQAATASSAPLMPGLNLGPPVVNGTPCKTGIADYRAISPGFFQVMGMRVLGGRDFNMADIASAPSVAIINQTALRQCWSGKNPVGEQFTLEGPGMTPGDRPIQVVGVVNDVHEHSVDIPAPAIVYLPQAQITEDLNKNLYQSFGLLSAIVVRTSRNVDLSIALPAAVEQVDPEQPIAGIHPAAELVGESVGFTRMLMLLMTAFAGLALLLTGVGLYGVLSYHVAQRTREIGVRMALGANAARVLALVLREGLMLVLAGAAIGIVGTFAVTRLLKSVLFGVGTMDPWALAGAIFALLICALLASYIPARRATKVDPMVALRYE